MSCNHKRTKGFSIPQLYIDFAEVCLDCGRSRSVWEQGESDWMEVTLYIDLVILIDNLTSLKKEFEDLGLDKLTTKFNR